MHGCRHLLRGNAAAAQLQHGLIEISFGGPVPIFDLRPHRSQHVLLINPFHPRLQSAAGNNRKQMEMDILKVGKKTAHIP